MSNISHKEKWLAQWQKLYTHTLPSVTEWMLGENIVLPTNYSRCVLNGSQLAWLYELYSKLYCVESDVIDFPSSCKKYRIIQLHGKQLGSYKSRSTSSSCVLAIWKSDVFGTPVASRITLPLNPLRAARINHFFLHSATINGTSFEHLLVSLSWFLYHLNLKENLLLYGVMICLNHLVCTA